ncbi:MAG TPA: NADP-dependent isocitrate dehydrogenase [Sediminispirochaeta sp.]|nr:NADP-dependent isocitrate dehydrogenase [Sediminispirochaeta sp.]
MNAKPNIVYTKTDEAPALATRSLLPLVRAFVGSAGIDMEVKDISLAGRIIAAFSDRLPEAQRRSDDLGALGELVEKPEANIIKLPNISASVAQINTAVRELQRKGYDIPDYPEEPKSEEERKIRARYDQVKGSAVNPVIRMGNSDRRVLSPIKKHARKHPHSMGQWSADSKSHVASMEEGDFFGSEKSITLEKNTRGRIEFHGADGQVRVLKESLKLDQGEVLDAAVMRVKKLRAFIEKEIEDAKDKDVLFSLHLKATMMKVSDPIIFGHVVTVFFKELFDEYGQSFKELGISPDNGMSELLAKIEGLPAEKRDDINKKIAETYTKRPPLAMVNSERGITNLHVPSDIIIDASMPAAIRAGGKMWGPDNQMHDMKAVIPDRSYAGIYQETIEFCKKNGAFDPRTMGSVSNVGLMAQKAEEYGSHDKTFKLDTAGRVKILDENGQVLLERSVEEGDIFRACQTKDVAIKDWVELGVKRARESGCPAVFWLDKERAHDSQLIQKAEKYLSQLDTEGLDIRIMNLKEAMRFSLRRMKDGLDTVSVTGNVLRDYLTDLFPILEVATSAKMLSMVPLLKGGQLFETGAGGSAPKHVQQFVEEGHLRWDSLGEFMAIQASLGHIARAWQDRRAGVLAETMERAIGSYLEFNRSPSRKTGEIDNRGSHYYLALYWAEALAEQKEDSELSRRFALLTRNLREKETQIMEELITVQGRPVDLGGYYLPDDSLADRAMRASETLNAILREFLDS